MAVCGGKEGGEGLCVKYVQELSYGRSQKQQEKCALVRILVGAAGVLYEAPKIPHAGRGAWAGLLACCVHVREA